MEVLVQSDVNLSLPASIKQRHPNLLNNRILSTAFQIATIADSVSRRPR